MSKSTDRFEKENALMFSRLEEAAGKVEERIAKVKTYEQRILGLEYELSKLSEERDHLKQRIVLLKQEKVTSDSNIMQSLTVQNFTIKNKIANIVSDIERREVSEEDVREFISTLIGEIDECLRLLQE